jgi:hypothetical protein
MSRRRLPAWRRVLTPFGWNVTAAFVLAGLLLTFHLLAERILLP